MLIEMITSYSYAAICIFNRIIDNIANNEISFSNDKNLVLQNEYLNMKLSTSNVVFVAIKWEDSERSNSIHFVKLFV